MVGAKNLALLQNQCKPSQLGNLINLITDKMAHKGKNCSLKLRKYYFCTRTSFSRTSPRDGIFIGFDSLAI